MEVDEKELELLRAIATAADKYDKVEGSYLALKKAIEAWRKYRLTVRLQPSLDKLDDEAALAAMGEGK